MYGDWSNTDLNSTNQTAYNDKTHNCDHGKNNTTEEMKINTFPYFVFFIV
jgi:hypothetical protein